MTHDRCPPTVVVHVRLVPDSQTDREFLRVGDRSIRQHEDCIVSGETPSAQEVP